MVILLVSCGGGTTPTPVATDGRKTLQPGQARSADSRSEFSLAQAGWTTEVAASVGAGWASWTSSIAVTDVVYIAYYEGILKDMMLATKTGGVWASQTLDAPFDNGRYNSIALTSSGTPQITYHRLGGSLRFYNGAATIVLDATPDSGAFNDITIDDAGDLYVSYSAIVSPNRVSRLTQLRFARRAGSVWTTEVVDSGPANATSTIALTSIALLPGNIPAIAYRGTGNSIRYATRNGAPWMIQDVPGTSNPSGISLVVDAQGHPHILWSSAGSGGAVWHTWNSGGVWNTEQVGPSAVVGSPNAAVIAADGFIYVAAYEWFNTKDLVLFREGPAGWTKETLDASGDTGKNAAIAAGPDGCLHISHFNDTTDTVLHTYQTSNCPGAPQSFTLTISIVGSGTVIAPGIFCPGDCLETYLAGTVVNLFAIPDGGWQFGGFTGDPDCIDGLVTMSADRGCTANFFPVGPLP
ncbi:MAG: InlB B-repeat-containing protein [bacterium JZ-2024 1]